MAVSRNVCFVGVIFQNGFSPKAVQPEAPSFRRDPRTHLKVQGPFDDEGTFQECRKSWILKIPLFGETENWRPGVYFVAKYVSAHSRRTKTPSIAIWGKICFWASFSVFQFFTLLDPYWTPSVCFVLMGLKLIHGTAQGSNWNFFWGSTASLGSQGHLSVPMDSWGSN